MKVAIFFAAVCALSALNPTIVAQVFISEYCADPYNFAMGGIDANGDGIAATSASQSNDEFVEIVNLGPAAVDVGNWTLSDTIGVRYTFPAGMFLGSGAAVVVFGGGDVTAFNAAGAGLGVLPNNPALPLLGLNNSTDSIVLRDANSVTVDAHTYLSNLDPDYGDGESVVRNPETQAGTFAKISTVTPALRHSAGYRNDGTTMWSQSVTNDPALGAAANGTVGVGSGGPFDVLFVNGSAGGMPRRVDIALSSSITIDLVQPSTNPFPAAFLLVGYVGVPGPEHVTTLPFGIGSLCIPSPQLTPGYPGSFVLANSYGPDSQALLPATLTPWTAVVAGLPFPFQFTLQGVIAQDPGSVRATNGVLINVE